VPISKRSKGLRSKSPSYVGRRSSCTQKKVLEINGRIEKPILWSRPWAGGGKLEVPIIIYTGWPGVK